MYLVILLRQFSEYGVLFQKGRYMGIKGRVSFKEQTIKLLRKECFIRKEDNYETFSGTLMYYRDTYETFSGYGIFFPKIRCTGIKRTVRFNEQRLLSRKEVSVY